MTIDDVQKVPIMNAEEQIAIRTDLLGFLYRDKKLDAKQVFGVVADTLCFLIMAGADGDKAEIERVSKILFEDMLESMIYQSNQEREIRKQGGN